MISTAETTDTNSNACSVALSYIARGWAPIPIPFRTKVPKGNGWERLRISVTDVPKYFTTSSNIGVLNGEPSGWLVDIDLDHPLARELADDFLPATPAEFGRESSRRSHRIYRVIGKVATTQRRLPKVDGKAPMIVELRSTGSQTIFPGSVHPGGELIEWDSNGEPAIIAADELLAAVNALAVEVEKRLGLTRKAKSVPENLTEQNGKAIRLPVNITDRARKYLAKIPPAVSDQGGHNQTFCAACVLVCGFSLDRGSALELLREWNQSCDPPWSERELEHKIDSALKQPGERGYLLNGKTSATPSQVTGSMLLHFRHTTDCGNAERFAEQHGADVRYCHQWAKWIVWDGRRWAVDQSGKVMRLAKRTARSIYVEASQAPVKDTREALAKWASASERRERLVATIALAQSEQPIPIAVESLDADPWLFNVENGTIDLRTGELREHRREDYLTKLCPVEYPTEPGIDPDLWLTFMDRIFGGNVALVRFIQRLIGMALVGEVQEHILPIFHGVGANGKSVTLETVCGMLGNDYAMNAPASLLMASKSGRHPTELADLHGKRFVAAVETADGGRLSESLVKELTGGDSIRARRMREDFWQFRPSHTVVLATNHKPTVRGTDHGIWRRIRLVPFNVVIPDHEQDKELANKLKAEWPAILKWAVAGCLDWQRNGLQAPEDVVAATDNYRNDMDVLGEFIEDRCVVGPHNEARARDLYRAYKDWAVERGEFVETQTRFGARLGERGFAKSRARDGVFYRGLGLAALQV